MPEQTFISPDEPVSPPPSVLSNPTQAKIAIASSREARGQRREAFNEQLQSERLENSFNAQALHEAQFGEKSEMDAHKMSLDDLQASLSQAKTVEALVAARAKLENDYRTTITGAALAERLSQLDPTDSNFEKDRAEAFAKYSLGAGTKAVQLIDELQKTAFTQNTMMQRQQQNAVFQAGVVKRVARVSNSDVDPALKSAVVDDQGNVNVQALEAAEKAIPKPLSAGAKSFYAGTTKQYGLGQADLNKIDQAGGISYVDKSGNLLKHGSEDANKQPDIYFAKIPSLDQPIPLNKFNAMISAHRNIQRGIQNGNVAADAAAEPEPTAEAAPEAAPAAPDASTAAANGNPDAVKAALQQFLSTGGQPEGAPSASSEDENQPTQ